VPLGAHGAALGGHEHIALCLLRSLRSLIGALAALRYRATARLTTDADFLVERVPGIAEAFEAAGYEVTPAGDDHAEPDVLQVRGKGDRIDVLFASVEYQEVALRRAVDHVLSVEDVIVHKLIAWRTRDRDDIASVLEAGHDLEVGYIEEWAARWDVLDRWHQARAAR
jgi:hypothetical protein